MADVISTLSIITLNGYILNTTVQRQRRTEWMKIKHDTSYAVYKETLQIQRTNRLILKGWENYILKTVNKTDL